MKTRGGAKIRATMGLCAALLTLALVGPATLSAPGVAHAAPAGCSVSGESFGTQTTGSALVASGKTADVVLPPGGTNSVNNTNNATVSTGAITDTSLDVSVPTLATAASTSTVDGVAILAGAVTGNFQSVSTSSSDGGTASTSSVGTYQSYSINGGPTQTTPAPNTRVDVPGVGFAIVNEQTPTGNGTNAAGLTVIGFDLHVITGTAAVPAGTEIFIASATSGVSCSGLVAPLATGTAAAAGTQTAIAAGQTAAAQTAASNSATAAAQTANAGAAQTAAAQTATSGSATAAAQTAASNSATAAAQTATSGSATAAAQTAASNSATAAAQTASAGASQTAAAQTAAAQTANASASQTAAAQTAAAGATGAGAAQTANAGASQTAAAQTANAGAAQTANAGASQTAAAQTAVAATQTAAAGTGGSGGATNTVVPGAASTAASGTGNTSPTAATNPAQAPSTATARASTSATPASGQAGPSLVLRPPMASPGGAVTITGKGFGRRERVTLSLNGAAFTAVVAKPDGTFTATFRVPAGLLNGANSLGAIGAASGLSAVSTLTGRLTGATTFYFVGASTMPGERANLAVLNPNARAARVDVTFYYRDGTPRHARFSVAAHSRGTASLNSLAGNNKAFGVALTADRIVSAQLAVARRGEDDFSLLGVSAPANTWYLAEGYTGLTFHETLALLNPGRATARVQVRLLPFGGRAARTVTVTVAPRRAQLVDVNRLMPGRSLSVIATSRAPIVLSRLLTFSTRGYGATARMGVNTPAMSWLFAEGTTTTRFQTFLTVLNPNRAGATVTARFYSRTGSSLGRRTIYVPGLRRANIKLNDILRASGVASVVTGNLPIVVERPEYFGSPNGRRIAGSDVFGRNGAGLRWAFPDGTTGGRSEFLLIYNPSTTPVVIDATGYGSDGRMMVERFAVPPTARATIDVNRRFRGLTAQHSLMLRAANGRGFVAEQTVFAPDFSTLDGTQGAAS